LINLERDYNRKFKNSILGGVIMKTTFQLFLLTVIFCVVTYAQYTHNLTFQEVITQAEENPELISEARNLTALLDIPHTIYLPEKIFIQAMAIEEGRVVYAVFNNIIDVYENGEVAYWQEIVSRFDLTKARIHFVNKPTQNPTLGYPEPQIGDAVFATKMLMVPDWTNDGVATLNDVTGDLINASFIVDPTNLSSPKEANLAPWGNITVSDQIDDGVMEYDTAGAFIRFFAPAGGANTNILNNVRGHNFRANGNMVVCNSDAGNPDAVAEFDQSGNYLGNFIANSSGGLDSPFDIVFRTSDCLVSASSSNAIHRYDLNGVYINDLVSSGIAFPQQILEMPNGNIAVAGFSIPSGIYIYSPTGTLLKTLNVVTGNRSVYLLPNGNIITTNGTGVHEIDSTSGVLVRTIIAGANYQYVSLYDYTTIPVELTSFTANVVDENVVLSWATATETNNQGFEIERSVDGLSFINIGYVPGFGTTTEPNSYSYTDQSVTSGKYYYRLKQIDFDGSFTYSGVVEADVSLPAEFSLEQNYPNPFNPATTIEFSLPADAQVKISVYNLVGEKVAEVVNKDFAAGNHRIEFNASQLTSGVYLYKLDAVDITGKNYYSIKKMTLLK
jgi:hypothetical protein